jgi:cyclic pyranopterin phosphate synthase
MPAEIFGPGYRFLPKDEILNFDELVRTVRLGVRLGVTKVRLTGGEPLLRRGVEDLVAMIAAVPGVEDLAMTTNGILLNHHARNLREAGLHRVTVSLDALDEEVFARMNGVGAKVERVLTGIRSARDTGFPVKVNMVLQRGVNEQEILPMVKWCRDEGVTLRMIEFMDVGETNGWDMSRVVAAKEILQTVRGEFSLTEAPRNYRGEVASRWVFDDGMGELGIISSVSQPFCGDCSRIRVSAEGKIFTCLFASEGADLRACLRSSRKDEEVLEFMERLWSVRKDRYSEERGGIKKVKAEMSYLGG